MGRLKRFASFTFGSLFEKAIDGQAPPPKPGNRLGHNGGPPLETKPEYEGRDHEVEGSAQNPNRISTRLPLRTKEKGSKEKVATDEGLKGHLTVGYNSLRRAGTAFKSSVARVRGYNQLTHEQLKGDDHDVAEHFIEHVKRNLLFLHDQMPEATRNRAKLWYDGAHKLTAKAASDHGMSHASAAGVYAALSPQKDWHQNVSLGDRMINIYHTKQDHPWTDEMEAKSKELYNTPALKKAHEAIRNQPLSKLSDPVHKAAWIRAYDEAHNDRSYKVVSPEGERMHKAVDDEGKPKTAAWQTIDSMAKAVKSIEAKGDIKKISSAMGKAHKVRNFFNNIVDPNGHHGDVTIDTHAVAAGQLKPFGSNDHEVHHNFGTAPQKPSAPKAKNGKPLSSKVMDTFNRKMDTFKSFKGAGGSDKEGIRGSYGLYAEAYRRAADERKIKPREMQSITWEGVKGLFEGKGAGKKKNLDSINEKWNDYQSGKASQAEVQHHILHVSGGMSKPEWEK